MTIAPDIELTPPAGWSLLPNDRDAIICGPDDRSGELVIVVDEEGFIARDLDLDGRVAMLRHRVAVFGEVLACTPCELACGPALRAEVMCTGRYEHLQELIAWLVLPLASPPLSVFWFGHTIEHGDTAREIVATMQCDPLEATIELAMGPAYAALEHGSYEAHAVFAHGGEVTRLLLEDLPPELWDDACRRERARVDASVVVQVLPPAPEAPRVGRIYAESAARQVSVWFQFDSTPVQLPSEFTSRVDLFAPPDPAAVLRLEALER